MKRRSFLKGTGLAMTSMALPSASFADGHRQLGRIGIQLYTVREQMAEDSAGTLAALAEIGYDEVEFAGLHGHSPADVRAMLDDTGLDAPSGHVSLDLMRNQAEETIEGAQVIGMDYLALGWLAPEERKTLSQYRSHAELCNRFGEQCKAAGIQFAWHNHEFEFEMLDGKRPMDLLLAETDADLMKVELDFYWIAYASADPFDFFDRYAGRIPLCHVKDMAADRSMTDVGAGTIEFAKIFASSEQAGLKHYFVERDDSPDPLASAAASFAAISTINY